MIIRRLLPICGRYTTRNLRPASSSHRFFTTNTIGMNVGKPLDFESGPLVWIDCEMTGLIPRKDKLIEIAVLITDGNLELVDEGIEFVIHADKKLLDGMDEWCTKQHGQSGLTQACLDSPYSTEYVAQEVLKYIKKWIPTQRIGVLAGNSVHFDRVFLAEEMPEVTDWLHYRIVDVSTIKELSRRWYPSLRMPRTGESSHRALDDIRGSIRELKWYRDHIFVSGARHAARSTSSDTNEAL
ncbi:ribonuclease H-like protein [Wolfiporia cocos MD-104 SS10]|uniref:Ribonuclease H-like protein n=1 Tax=Wolfiporia cocos (strain MD-104) TaxID=742152 RepID=A0A2H3JA72_WOLCO|nr:ribonuclease H-like protein [Wolfiporia cocos MD-104 SS10]